MTDTCYIDYKKKVVDHFAELAKAFDVGNDDGIDFSEAKVDIAVDGEYFVFTIHTPSGYMVKSSDLEVKSSIATNIKAEIRN